MLVLILTLAVLALWIYQVVLSRRWKGDVSRLEYDLRLLASKLVVAAPVAAAEVVAPPPAEPAPVREVATPTFVEPVAEQAAGPGWETVLGGSWLNKIGVLVLVIGLALFIGYSFGHLGPAGRIAVALAVSGSMLGAGVALERRASYKIAARGLIGGGWAALYVTTYAAHAMASARVIDNAVLATLLLCGVAVGMILHSLSYRSQVVTGLAYFVAFVTLAISQLTAFAVIALLPLVVSLLYLAYRFDWTAMALLGLPAAYGIYIFDAARSSGGSLAVGQSILLVYWLAGEAFDVLSALRRRNAGGNPIPLFPVNAFAFVAASFMQWQAVSPGTLYQLFALSAAVYLGSSFARILLLPVASFPRKATALDRARRGSYEGALTLSAALTAVAISIKLSGLSISVAFLIEAELLFFAGLYYRQSLLRHLASVLLFASVARMIVADVPGAAQLAFAGRDWHAWSPVALLHAGVFYLNRALCPGGVLYGHAAAGLLLLILGFELPLAWVGLSWLVLALILFELGARAKLRDFALQAYWVGAASLWLLFGKNVLATGVHTDWRGWMPQVLAAALLYGTTLRWGSPGDNLERRWLFDIGSFAGTVLLAAFMRNVLPASLTAIGWTALVLILLAAGRRLQVSSLQIQSFLLAAITFIRASTTNLQLGWSLGVLTTVAVIASFYAAEFLCERAAQYGRILFSALATLLLALLLWHEVSGRLLTVALGAQGVALLFAGFPLRERCMRLSGLGLLLLCVLKLFVYDFRHLEMPFRVLSFILLGVILIGVSFVYSRFRERVSKYL